MRGDLVKIIMTKKSVLLYTYLFLALFCTVSLTLFTIWEHSFTKNRESRPGLLDESWTVSLNGNVEENVQLSGLKIPSLPENSKILLEKTLPAFSLSQPSLWIQTVYSSLEVSLDDRIIYSYGSDLAEKGINVGSGFHIIPLPADAQGKTIKINYTTEKNDAFSSLKPVFIQNSSEAVPNFINRYILPLFSSIFLIFLGAIGSVITVGALFLRKKIASLLILSQFSLWVGIGVITNTDLVQLFSPNFTINSYLEYTALYLTALSLILFFFLTIAKTKFEKISSAAVASLFLVYCAASITLERLHVIHLPETLFIYQLLCSAMIIFSICVCFYKIIKGNGRILLSSLSFSFLVFFCGLDIGRYIIQKSLLPTYSLFYNSLLTIGVIIFIVSELLFFFINLEAESSVFTSLTDVTFTPSDYSFLTSKKKIVQTVNELNKNHVYYTFVTISFLNVPNEEDAFKQYGKTITNLLKTVFDCYGLISYYENNTFVIVVSEVAEVKLQQLIKTFNQLLEYKSVKENFPQVKTSIGYAFSYESSYKSFKAVFTLAQQRKKRLLIS